MISICTKGCQYAVRAMIYLAGLDPAVNARQFDIARATHVPLPYLSKLLSSLARSGLVVTRRGPSGGVRLGRPAETITLEDVVTAVDGRDVKEACVLGYSGCTPETPCALHGSWVPIRQRIERDIEARTLADLARQGNHKEPTGA